MSDFDKNMTSEEFSHVIDEKFTKYALMSLEDRAIPDARDGLKPSQRRVLVAMAELKLNSGGATEKSAKITGHTSGNYHPHGEAVVYPTMYRLAQPWVMRYPLVIGQGNFGNVDGDSPAAQRYTEAKLSQFGESILRGLSEDTVQHVPNYNEKLLEPTVLPGAVPNLLMNGCEGIAVGWATKILPHNLKEIVAVIKERILNPKMDTKRLMELMPGPDFPMGGEILGRGGIRDYYETGRGSLRVRGEYHFEKQKNKTSIVVTSFPYQSSPSQFTMEVEKLIDSGKYKNIGIQDMMNLSSKKTGTKVVIELSSGTTPELVESFLLSNTCLMKSVSINTTVLIDGKVVSDTPILQLIDTFINHRRTVLRNGFIAELTQAKDRLHILDGLLGVVNKIDEVIAIIRASSSPEEAEEFLLRNKFVETPKQAKAVLAITLRQLTKLESDKIIAEKDKLTERCEFIESVLGSQKKLDQVVIKEQEAFAKRLGDDRRTVISDDMIDISDEDLVKEENLIVALTGEGYVRSTPSEVYRVQNRGGMGSMGVSKTASEENIIEMFELNSKDILMFFTNKGFVYQRRAFNIPQNGKTNKGFHVSNLLNLTDGEFVTNMLGINKDEKEGSLVIVTKNGFIKKTKLTEYDTRRNVGIKAVKLTDDDEVAFAFLTYGNKDIFIVTENGKCVRYNESIIPEQGRGTRGSRALNLEKSDRVSQVMAVDPNEEPDILVVTVGGIGKKTSSKEYRAFSSRNVKGYSVMSKKAIEKSGKLAGACCVSRDEDVLLITSSGKCIRIDSATIRSTSRTTIGVKMVRLDGMDSVIKVAKLASME